MPRRRPAGDGDHAVRSARLASAATWAPRRPARRSGGGERGQRLGVGARVPRSAAASGRGERRGCSRRVAPGARAPAGAAIASPRRSATSARSQPLGRWSGSVAVSTRLAALGEPHRELGPPARVELAHHVVEEHQRRVSARLEQGAALGEEQRQHRRALLPLRAVAAQRASGERDRQLVQMRSVGRVAPRQIRVAALAKLRGQLPRVGRPRCAAGSEARRRPAGRARPPPRRTPEPADQPPRAGSRSAPPPPSPAPAPRRRANRPTRRPDRIRPRSAFRWASARP